MATIDKDFKVKNGLIVALGGSFGGPVFVDTPTENLHAATKEYVDTHGGGGLIPTHAQEPINPVDGQVYFNTATKHLSVYSAEDLAWIMLASFDDAVTMQQHIHDTAIDGTGLVVTVFQDAGFYYSIFTTQADGGSYDTVTWAEMFDGGIPIDNFN